MNTREIAEEYRLSHWSGIMRDRVASGLTIKAFCKTAGFHENVYYYWQRKLREVACREMLTTAQEKAVVPSGWAVCEPAKAESSGSSIYIEIGKCRVSVDADVKVEALEKVCRVLMALC